MMCHETGYVSDWDEPEGEDYEEEIDEGPEVDWEGYHLISAPVSSAGQPIRKWPMTGVRKSSAAA